MRSIIHYFFPYNKIQPCVFKCMHANMCVCVYVGVHSKCVCMCVCVCVCGCVSACACLHGMRGCVDVCVCVRRCMCVRVFAYLSVCVNAWVCVWCMHALKTAVCPAVITRQTTEDAYVPGGEWPHSKRANRQKWRLFILLCQHFSVPSFRSPYQFPSSIGLLG